jgi:hypothetical protein
MIRHSLRLISKCSNIDSIIKSSTRLMSTCINDNNIITINTMPYDGNPEKLSDFLQYPVHKHRNTFNILQNNTFKTTDFLASQIKESQEKSPNFISPMNVKWRSRYGVFNHSRFTNMCLALDTHITDLLVFNKNYVVKSPMVMERLIGNIHATINNESNCIMDGWHVSTTYSKITTFQNSVKYVDDYDFSTKTLIRNDSQKYIIARGLIALMNETSPNDMNWTNYHTLNEWLSDNEYYLMTMNCHYYEGQITPQVNVSDSDLIIKVDDLVSVDYIQSCVNNALEKKFTQHIINIPNSPQMAYTVEGDTLTNTVNLHELKQLMTHNELKNLVDGIHYYRHTHINCGDIPIELMLMELHNSLNPSNYLTAEGARYLLSQNNYFSYFHGCHKVRLNFKYYPIMNVDKYGYTRAKKCLENVKKGNLTQCKNK